LARTRLFTGSLVCGRPNAIVRAAPAAGSWLRRFSHRLGDTWTLLTFSLSPSALLSPSARLHVGGVVLQLAQWPGSKVGSGGYLWGASRRLASWLETNGDGDSASSPSRLIPGLKLLELGAGTGALGLAAAVLGANVTITDQASFCFPTGINERPVHTLIDLALHNVDQNRRQLLKTVTDAVVPQVAEMRWGETAMRLPHPQYDIIIGADILLFTSAHAALVQSLRRFSSPSTVVLIEHTDRSSDSSCYPTDLLLFLKVVAEDGLWRASIVRDHGRHITVRMVYR